MTGAQQDPVFRVASAAWSEVDGETVLLDTEHAVYLGVNRAGTVLWEALVSGATEPELVAALTDRFDITPQTATKDVQAFLQMCARRGLLISP